MVPTADQSATSVLNGLKQQGGAVVNRLRQDGRHLLLFGLGGVGAVQDLATDLSKRARRWYDHSLQRGRTMEATIRTNTQRVWNTVREETAPHPAHDRYKVARVADVPPGAMRAVVAGLTPVLLANVDGTIYALHNLCPHLSVPLSLGKLDGCVVTCLAHGSQFDVTSGAVVTWVGRSLPLGAEQMLRFKAAKPATTYGVLVHDEDIYVLV
jgi:nitrite reductase/ring-hydroxylating ferredoxin subunit